MTQSTTSIDIETVGSVLRVTYPKVLDLQWDELVRSVPKSITRVSFKKTVWFLEILLDDAVHPHIDDLEEIRKTIVTVSKAGISSDDLRHLIHALIQRANMEQGLITLYCVMVGLKSKALALIGAPGDGKTITSLAMRQTGTELLAAELALIDVKQLEREPMVVGGSRTIMVRRAAMLQYFPRHTGKRRKAN